MKRISLALFAIIGVVSAGIFATSAYFTDTITQNNYTFTTSNADLKFGFCTGLATDCSGTAASLDSVSFTPAEAAATGPGKTGDTCLVIENISEYNLHLSSQFSVVSENPVVAAPNGLQDAFLVKAEKGVDSSCNPGTGTLLYSLQSARSAASFTDLPAGDLAAGARIYVIISNAWDSSWDQTALENGTLKLNTSVTGKTD